MSANPLQLAVLVSGSGTTLQNLIDEIEAKRLNAQIAIVIASRPDILAIERARKAGLKHVIVDRREFDSVQNFSSEVFRHCEEAGVDLVCFAGWLCLVKVPPTYHLRVMNIHPALLPSFGGKGMYGEKVHRAVLDSGCKVSGCTVHFVDATYDTGPIIAQHVVPVQDDDTPQALAARVFKEEKIAYPHAIRLFHQKRLRVEGRRVRILPPT